MLNEVYIMENENVKENVEKEVNEGKVENFVWQDKYNVSAKSISEGRICTITDEDVGKVVEVPYIVKDLIPEHSVGINNTLHSCFNSKPSNRLYIKRRVGGYKLYKAA